MGRPARTTKRRRLDPDMWQEDVELGLTSRDAQLLFVKLITQADDDGRLIGRPAWIRAKAYPFDEELTSNEVEMWLTELDRAGLILRYAHADQPYLYLPGFKEHQVIDQRWYRPSKLPAPPSEALSHSSGVPHEKPVSDTGETHEEHATQGSEEPQTSKSSPPAKAGGDDAVKEEPETSTATPEVPLRDRVPTGGRMSDLLADGVAKNHPNGKRPTVTDRWLHEERKLVERDGYSEHQIRRTIEFVVTDSFESANVLSMPKLRERFDNLIAKARLAAGHAPAAAGNGLGEMPGEGQKVA